MSSLNKKKLKEGFKKFKRQIKIIFLNKKLKEIIIQIWMSKNIFKSFFPYISVLPACLN